MEALTFIKKSDSITVWIDNYPYTVRREQENFEQVYNALRRSDWEKVIEVINLGKAIGSYMKGSIVVRDGNVYDGNEVINGAVVDRIKQFMKEGLPVEGLLNFIADLKENPSFNSRAGLFTFLDHRNIPITPKGSIIAYKAITNDWKDKWTNTIDNGIGKVTSMARHLIDDNPANHCAPGLHCGSIEYVRGYARNYGSPNGDRIVLVEVQPRNVVAVPNDYSCQKMRTTGYKVIGEFNGELPRPLHDSVNPYDDTQADDDDLDFEFAEDDGWVSWDDEDDESNY